MYLKASTIAIERLSVDPSAFLATLACVACDKVR